MRRRTGTGFGLPRLVLVLLPLLFAAAGFVPWLLTQTVLVATPARLPDWPLLLTAAGLLLLGGLLVTALLWTFLLGPVFRTADAAARAAEGDESAWPELEVATGAARDLGAILAETLRRGKVSGSAENELNSLHEALATLGEEARAIAAGDWSRRPRGEHEAVAALAERVAAQVERSAELARAATALAAAIEVGSQKAWDAAAPDVDGDGDEPSELLADAAERASALQAELAAFKEHLTGAGPEPEPGQPDETGVEAAQRLGLLALNASLEAGRVPGGAAAKFGALAEELGREGERVRAALFRNASADQAAAMTDQRLDTLERLETDAASLARKLQAARARAELGGEPGATQSMDWSGLLEQATEIERLMALVRLEPEPGATAAEPIPEKASPEPSAATAEEATEPAETAEE